MSLNKNEYMIYFFNKLGEPFLAIREEAHGIVELDEKIKSGYKEGYIFIGNQHINMKRVLHIKIEKSLPY